MTINWIQKHKLTVGGTEVNPDLRVRFHVTSEENEAPDTLSVIISNLSPDTAVAMTKLKGKKVTLDAGYQDNCGTIFSGEITNVLANGRESPTDTFVSIYAQTNDKNYNHAKVNKTLKAGSTNMDVYNTLLKTLQGVSQGNIPIAQLKATKFPRSFTLFGDSKHHLRKLAKDVKGTFHIDKNDKLNIYQPASDGDGTILLNSSTGMIGQPIQTTMGIIVRFLINPNIQIHSVVHIDQKSVQEAIPQLTYAGPAIQETKLPDIQSDGQYKVIHLIFVGDSRGYGGDWFGEATCIGVRESAPPDAASRGLF